MLSKTLRKKKETQGTTRNETKRKNKQEPQKERYDRRTRPTPNQPPNGLHTLSLYRGKNARGDK